MEPEDLSLPLPLYLYSDTLPNLMKQTTNPIVKNMIRVYFEVKKILLKDLVYYHMRGRLFQS